MNAPDDTELEARIVEAVGHDGDVKIATRGITKDLDHDGVVRTVTIAVVRLRRDHREARRAHDLVEELHESREDEHWNRRGTLDELANCLRRILR